MGGVKAVTRQAWGIVCRVRDRGVWGERWVIGEGRPRYMNISIYSKRSDARKHAARLRGCIGYRCWMYAQAVRVRITTEVVG